MRNDHGEGIQLVMSTLLILWGITCIIVTLQIAKHLIIAYRQHRTTKVKP